MINDTTYPAKVADSDLTAGQAAPVPAVEQPAVMSHLIVGAAIVVVASAIGVALALEAELPAAAAAGCAIAFALAAVMWHLQKPARPAAAKREPSLTRQRPARAAMAEPAAPAPLVATTEDAAKPVEPSDLALALLASLNASGGPARRAAETHGTGLWTTVPEVADVPPAPAAAPLAQPVAPPPLQPELPMPGIAGHAHANAYVQAQPQTSGLDESEVERVDRLVRRLADDVNRAEAMRQSAATAGQLSLFPEGSQSTHDLEASIQALRRASFAGQPEHVVDHTAVAPAHAASAVTLAPVPPAPPVQPPAPPTYAAAPADDWFVATPTRVPSNNRRAEILSALNAQRIDVYLEPILGLDDQRPQHYEVSMALRTETGHAINLAEAASDLSGTGLLPLIDQARIARAAVIARKLAERGKAGSVFTDVAGETIDDGGFRETFASGAVSVGAFPGQLVLTLPQAHVATFTAADWRTVARLRAAGFAFALSDVTSLDMDFAALAGAGFAFARLDAEAFLIGLPIAGGTVPPADICRHLAACGLTLIVGGIVEEHQHARIFGFGVLFGQGRLFGGPRPVKSDATAPAPAANYTAATARM